MIKPYFYLWLVISIFCSSCLTDQASLDAPFDSIHLLLFKKEKILEIWVQDSLNRKKWATFSMQEKIPFPIGKFELSRGDDGSYSFQENEFYKRKDPQAKGTFPSITAADLFQLLSNTEAFQLADTLIQGQAEWSVYVFPNDARGNRSFLACTHCPRWMPEMYSRLWLELKDYPKQR